MGVGGGGGDIEGASVGERDETVDEIHGHKSKRFRLKKSWTQFT